MVLVGFGLAAIIYAGFFVASLGQMNSNAAAYVGGWYRHKEEVAAKLPSPRILVVGGSSALYGITARRIEDVTGVRAVNFGVHGALSLEYQLDKIRRVAREGDTVLLALEYALYLPGEVNTVFSDYVLGADPGFLGELPMSELPQWTLAASWDRTLERLVALPHQRKKLREEVDWELENKFNDRGDRISNLSADQGVFNAEAIEDLGPLRTIVKGDWSEPSEAWTTIGKFVGWCRESGVEVLATFPNTIYFAEYEGGELEAVSRILEEGYATLGVPLLGTAEEFMYPEKDFFDSIYHLNRAASEARTDRLIELLRER